MSKDFDRSAGKEESVTSKRQHKKGVRDVTSIPGHSVCSAWKQTVAGTFSLYFHGVAFRTRKIAVETAGTLAYRMREARPVGLQGPSTKQP